jgi:hypothetical protein
LVHSPPTAGVLFSKGREETDAHALQARSASGDDRELARDGASDHGARQRSAAPGRVVSAAAGRLAAKRNGARPVRSGQGRDGEPRGGRATAAGALEGVFRHLRFSHASAGLRQFYAAIWRSSAQPITRKIAAARGEVAILKEIFTPTGAGFWYRCSGPTAHLAA